jgi:hypothetical protein
MSKNWLVYEFQLMLKESYRKLRGRPSAAIKSRVNPLQIRKYMRQNGLAYDEKNQFSWFYTAYDRNDKDKMTNYTMNFIVNNFSKDSRVLVTGCGTGITLFHLMDSGFSKVEGLDYLDSCVEISNEVARLGSYNTKIWKDDGFNPKLEGSYDVITALHWVFSAWSGNYGNDKVSLQRAFDPETRQKLVNDLFSKYAPHLNKNGVFIIELTDAVADYRLEGEKRKDHYPVRHTPEQIKIAAELNGLIVDEY